jgi:hypothetical protein
MCGVRYEHASRLCANCGAPLPGWSGDGPGDGVEVVAATGLDELIDQRARAILDRERAAEAERARRAADHARLAAARTQLEQACKEARKRRDDNLREPRTVFGSAFVSMIVVAVFTLVVGLFPGTGLMAHLFLVPVVGFSPAGLACPAVCDGCSPWARAFSWNFKGDYQENNGRMGYAFVCANPAIDVDQLRASDIPHDPLNTRLQPYMLSSVVVWLLEVAVCVPGLALLLGPIFGLRRRRRVFRERAQREADLVQADAALRDFQAAHAG